MRYLYVFIFLIIGMVCKSEDYPRLAVVDSDTLVLITVPQLKIINEKLVDLDEEREKVRLLSEQISTYEEITKSLEDQIKLRDDQSIVLKKVIENYEISMDLYDKKSKRDYRRSLIISGVGISIGIAGILFFTLN